MHSIDGIGSHMTWQIGVLMVYTFFYGICMYLVMRVTGSIVWAILLHGITDPTLFLATGGVDTGTAAASNVFLSIAQSGNFAVILFGAVAVFLIRGQVLPSRRSTPVEPVETTS